MLWSCQSWTWGRRVAWIGARNVHLGVKDAGRGLDDAGKAAVGLDLEDLTLRAGQDSEEVDDDILGLHVQDEREGQGLSLAGGDLDVVADGRQVAEDASAQGRILGQRLGGGQHPADEGKLDRPVLQVLHLNDRPRRVAVDELDTEARVGEVCGDVDLQFGDRGAGVRVKLRILWLLFDKCQNPSVTFD